MKHCASCKRLYQNGEDVCSLCGQTLEDVTDPDTPAVLLTAESFERERVEAALTDAGIPFSVSYCEKMPEQMSPSVTKADILIPIAYYSQAVKLCIGISALSDDCTEAQIAEQTNSFLKKSESKLGAAKRTTIRVVSAMAFLALVALAVFGTDFITSFIKGLFN